MCWMCHYLRYLPLNIVDLYQGRVSPEVLAERLSTKNVFLGMYLSGIRPGLICIRIWRLFWYILFISVLFQFSDFLVYTSRVASSVLQFKVHGQLPLRGMIVRFKLFWSASLVFIGTSTLTSMCVYTHVWGIINLQKVKFKMPKLY